MHPEYHFGYSCHRTVLYDDDDDGTFSFFSLSFAIAASRLWLLLAALSVCVLGQDSFYFSPQPADVRVRKGESATLRCGVSNADRVAFHWTLDGEPLRNTTRRFQQGSDLRLTRVDPSLDMGEFRCIATNASSGFSLASQGAQLNILCEYAGDVAAAALCGWLWLFMRIQASFLPLDHYHHRHYLFVRALHGGARSPCAT